MMVSKSLASPNVILGSDANDNIKRRTSPGHTAKTYLHPKLDAVISELATLKPTWTFVGVSSIRESEADNVTTFSIPQFTVRVGDEILGSICRERGAGYNEYKIMVNCPRIEEGRRRRGHGYTTDDPKKAIAKAKKMFGPMTTLERLRKAETHAQDYIDNAVYRHKSEIGKVRRLVQEAAQRYIQQGPGFEQFMLYVSTKMEEGERAKVLWAKETDDTLTTEMSVLQDIRDKLGSGVSSALIIRDAEKYIVRVGDKVDLHDDNTLPVELRTGLGLLKLVDKEHFVPGSGCRVSDDVFVVVLDSEGDNK
jgi:hypothetical protein